MNMQIKTDTLEADRTKAAESLITKIVLSNEFSLKEIVDVFNAVLENLMENYTFSRKNIKYDAVETTYRPIHIFKDVR